MHRYQTAWRLASLCLFLFLRSLGESVPSRFHPKQRLVAIDFYPLPKHCISFRLHQRPKPSFRIFFITLNSPPVFVEVFCLKTAEVKCAPKEKRKWDRKTGCNLCAQILIAGVWLLFFLSEPLPGYPDLLSIWKHSVFFFKNRKCQGKSLC